MFDEWFLGYDPSYEVIFQASWTTYEESGWIFIFQKNGKYLSLEGGYCVMAPSYDDVVMQRDLEAITPDQALNLMLEWAEYEDKL